MMRDYFLTTERIAFSHWMTNDISLAQSLWGDPLVTVYISKTGQFSEVEIDEKLTHEIQNQQQFNVQYWPIFDKNTSAFIGCCGLRPYDLDHHIYEIGFHLKPEFWGIGLGSEAAKAVMKYAHSHIGAAKLFAGHNPNNKNSQKVLERLGFKSIGNEFYVPTGLYHPSYLYDCPS